MQKECICESYGYDDVKDSEYRRENVRYQIYQCSLCGNFYYRLREKVEARS